MSKQGNTDGEEMKPKEKMNESTRQPGDSVIKGEQEGENTKYLGQ